MDYSMEMMREYVSKQYPGAWKMKVYRMPDRQVFQIYRRMTEEKPKKKPKEDDGGVQLNMFQLYFREGTNT